MNKQTSTFFISLSSNISQKIKVNQACYETLIILEPH
jgi:hypothetical protein